MKVTYCEVLREIGRYYLNRNQLSNLADEEAVEAARAEIYRLGITKVEVSVVSTTHLKVTGNNTTEESGLAISITTARPGLLIGKRAENIDNIERRIKDVFKLQTVKIHIAEATDYVLDLILPRLPVTYDPYMDDYKDDYL